MVSSLTLWLVIRSRRWAQPDRGLRRSGDVGASSVSRHRGLHDGSDAEGGLAVWRRVSDVGCGKLRDRRRARLSGAAGAEALSRVRDAGVHVLAWLVIRNEQWLTGGIYGIVGHPAPEVIGDLSLRPAAQFLLVRARHHAGCCVRAMVDHPLAVGPGLHRAARESGASGKSRRRYPALYAAGVRDRLRLRRDCRRALCASGAS